jgi:hypothetical protein
VRWATRLERDRSAKRCQAFYGFMLVGQQNSHIVLSVADEDRTGQRQADPRAIAVGRVSSEVLRQVRGRSAGWTLRASAP